MSLVIFGLTQAALAVLSHPDHKIIRVLATLDRLIGSFESDCCSHSLILFVCVRDRVCMCVLFDLNAAPAAFHPVLFH